VPQSLLAAATDPNLAETAASTRWRYTKPLGEPIPVAHYFSFANWRREVHTLSGWILWHMRKCYWLWRHDRLGRRHALGHLGVCGGALRVAGCRRGAWPMVRLVLVQQALKTATLSRYGLTLP
jgi:hypothetical protein